MLWKPSSETWGWASPRRAAVLRGGRALEAPGFATLLPPSHRPPQQVISVKTGRLAVLLIIHEASSAPIRRAGRGGEAAPAPRENTRLLGACLASRVGYRKGGLACFSHLLCACLTLQPQAGSPSVMLTTLSLLSATQTLQTLQDRDTSDLGSSRPRHEISEVS